MTDPVSRRAVISGLGALAAASVLGIGFVIRSVFASSAPPVRPGLGSVGGGMMGVEPADMRTYQDMFMRHDLIDRVVEEISGGVRTTTQSADPDLVAQLQAHVSDMYARLSEGSEVACMSGSLPTLFRNAAGYRRRLTMTSTGVIAEETAEDPDLVAAIRAHAREVTGFVQDGMPAMMGPMMGGAMMGPR